MTSSSRSRRRAPRARVSLVVVAVVLFLDMLVYGLVVPVIPAYSARMGATPAMVGVLFASYGVALLAATPIVGALSARVDRRRLVLAGVAGLMASTALFALASTVPELLGARLLQGIAAAGSWVGGLALIADAVPPEGRGRAFGVSTAASSLGTFCGPPLGGALADRWGYRAPFVTVAVLAGLACIGGTIALEASVPGARRTVSGAKLLADARVRAVCAFVAIGAGLLGVMEPMLPLDIAARLGGTASQIGLLFAVAMIAYGVSTVLVGWVTDKLGAALPMRVGWVMSALALPLLALPRSMPMQAAAMAAVGVALSALLTPSLRALAESADRVGGDYGVAYAAYNATYAVGLMIGASAGGRLVGALGVPGALTVLMAAMLVLGIAPAFALTRGREP